MSQYGLPRKTPMTPGTPPVSPSARAAHELLDMPVSEFAKKHFSQYASMIPEKYAKMSVREAYKGANFLEKQMFASKLATALPKGVTMADIDKAVNEAPPPPEKAAAPAAPAAAAVPAAPAAAASVAPAAAAPVAPAAAAPAAAPASGYTLPQSPPAARGPTVGAAAAMPQGNAALDYLAKYGGHASVLRDGKIVPVHPGTTGTYTPTNAEFAARLAAAGQAYQRETGKDPKYGEMSRGEDVQSVYYNRYKTGQGGIAAAPGRSQHQKGGATDLPDSGFRQWLNAGNKDRFGLHFPVKGDPPHVQMNPAFKGSLGGGGGTPPGVDPSVTAGAGPAAVAAARSAAATGSGVGSAASKSSADDPRGMVDYIRETAKRYGIDPEVAVRVAKSEGLGTFQSSVVKDGKREPSWGAFQLYTGGGLGNEFQKTTGLDPSDPKNEKATIDYALKHAADNGWGSWYGAKNTGIGDREGIGVSAKTDTPLDPTPNVGSGQSDYSSPPADTNVSTYDAANAIAPGSGSKDFSKDVGDIFSGFGDLMAKGPVAQNAARPTGSGVIPMPQTIPQGVTPTVDPRVADAQRQQLAMALQRLNSGRLV